MAGAGVAGAGVAGGVAGAACATVCASASNGSAAADSVNPSAAPKPSSESIFRRETSSLIIHLPVSRLPGPVRQPKTISYEHRLNIREGRAFASLPHLRIAQVVQTPPLAVASRANDTGDNRRRLHFASPVAASGGGFESAPCSRLSHDLPGEWRSSSRNNASARALSLGPPPAARPKGKKEQEIGPRSQARRQSLSTKNPFCTSIDFRRAHRQSAHKGLLVCQIVNGREKCDGKVWLAEKPNLPKGA